MRPFRAGNMEEEREASSRLKKSIKEDIDKYRGKLEWKIQQTNMRAVWSGMKSIIGLRPTNSAAVENCGVNQ